MLNNIKIGEVIRYFRMKNNMSQRELANIVGIDRTEISKIENNIRKTINDSVLKRICNVLNINYIKLVEKSDINNKENNSKKYEIIITETFKTKYIVSAKDEQSAVGFINDFFKAADVLECEIRKESESFSDVDVKEIKEKHCSLEEINYILFDEADILL